MYNIQHCFIRRPSDSTVSEDATTALSVRRSNHSARYHPEKIQEMLVIATVAISSVGVSCLIGGGYVMIIMVVAAAVIWM
jgi:hypothetical protein